MHPSRRTNRSGKGLWVTGLVGLLALAETSCSESLVGFQPYARVTPVRRSFKPNEPKVETVSVEVSDIPLRCEDPVFNAPHAPEGARMGAAMEVSPWRPTSMTLDYGWFAALYNGDREQVARLSAPIGGPPDSKGSLEVLSAPRKKGELARLRLSGEGVFLVKRDPAFDLKAEGVESDPYERTPFSFSGEVDAVVCGDIEP